MSCFGCFGSPKDLPCRAEDAGSLKKSLPVVQAENCYAEAQATAVQKPTFVPAAESPTVTHVDADAVQAEPLPPPPPWRSREELAEIALRLADASGPWLERAQTSASTLAASLGATLVSIWAFSSDKSTAVVLASGGALRMMQPQGYSVPVACVEGQRVCSSLQRVVSREAPLTWSMDTSAGIGARTAADADEGPSDLKHLAAASGMQHCAVLPLKHTGALAGALQISLGGTQPEENASTPACPAAAHSFSLSAAPDVADATNEANGEASADGKGAAVPNWLPHHLPDLMMLSPATTPTISGAGWGLSSQMASGAQAVPLPQGVVDLVAALRRCTTISMLISAVVAGLQDLTYRATAMHFCATPMLVHKSAVTAAIFQDCGPREGGGTVKEGNHTRGETESDLRVWPASTGNPLADNQDQQSRTVKAHVTHLNHTLMLQLLTGVDSTRHRRQYGGSVIQNCSEYMQDESNRGRDVSLCHRVGVADVGSLVLATGVQPGRVPLLATYLTSREPLPEPLLESALAVVQQALKLSVVVVQALLSPGGELNDEWSTLHDFHLNPNSIAVSTSCTPRSIMPRSVAAAVVSGKEPALGQGVAAAAAVPLSAANDEGTAGISGTATRRNLSFGITTSSAAAPRSNLGMMVSSIRSSLNQVLSQRAALEAEGLQDDVNGVELLKQIGQGGQGVVFCGTLHGLEVAIKVVGTEEGADEVYDIDDEGQMIKLKRVLKRDATELAVTTSISHPNIVQVFSYFMDVMVVEYVGQPDRFKLLPKAKGPSMSDAAGDNCGVTGPSNMIICMEYCDAGSLKHAVKHGCFRTAGSRPNMQALYTTLMEIALALRHLHALRLVHCDLKPSNILLKSSMRDLRGWVCKLSDFGCVRLMAEPASGQRPSFNLEYAVGTPSFMAPEMFCKGHPLDAAVDIYSFGILMWEVYTGGIVYDGVPPDKLPYHVVKRGLRPAFPPDSPSAFRSLAQACWASDPRSRPTAAALVTVLQRLLSSCASAAAAPSSVAGGG
ncbi:hypothetical protein PLESTB_001393200 [Pleodorina starrii]|uniref:Protein kinase domain-containing protein n=1 Tax=Pleodorina starrii TaxID=330485 RepID=A0A9W6BV29_9CHLO|nr:hypothetical protein PLESTM_000539300 [Pleodorina starrii]GLC58718.1 hypothetical protein PLESTB_001393200 [Pleodorina starrii]GLC75197.1 hypothetical protein PLESTF_001605900 [Pleodorina starrii]